MSNNVRLHEIAVRNNRNTNISCSSIVKLNDVNLSTSSMSVAKINIPTVNIPCMIFPILPNQSNPNLSPFVFYIKSNGVTVSHNVEWINPDSNLTPTEQNSEFFVSSEYHYVYNMHHVCSVFNSAVRKLWNKFRVENDTYLNDTGGCPVFSFDPESSYFSIKFGGSFNFRHDLSADDDNNSNLFFCANEYFFNFFASSLYYKTHNNICHFISSDCYCSVDVNMQHISPVHKFIVACKALDSNADSNSVSNTNSNTNSNESQPVLMNVAEFHIDPLFSADLQSSQSSLNSYYSNTQIIRSKPRFVFVNESPLTIPLTQFFPENSSSDNSTSENLDNSNIRSIQLYCDLLWVDTLGRAHILHVSPNHSAYVNLSFSFS
jgi:hypothetical protein